MFQAARVRGASSFPSAYVARAQLRSANALSTSRNLVSILLSIFFNPPAASLSDIRRSSGLSHWLTANGIHSSRRQYALDKWIYPSLGDTYLANVNNFSLKQLVEQMAAKLSPASIRDYSNIVKAVIASAIDDNGEEKFPRKWNDEFLAGR
jgi:hypothetical protein